MPVWLMALAWFSLAIGALSALAIAVDILRGNRQHMWIMNLVWPLTALYAGPLALWAYLRVGRATTHERMRKAKEAHEPAPAEARPFWQTTALATSHCGAGCTLGDILAEWFVFFWPLALPGRQIFWTWALDFVLAFAIGIVFQYFTIAPMRNLAPGAGVRAAVKADSASLVAWQVGMYAWMAIAVFVIFGHELPKTSPVFWFMMQIAMLIGFLTAYPINRWLLIAKIKERM